MTPTIKLLKSKMAKLNESQCESIGNGPHEEEGHPTLQLLGLS